MGDVLIRVEHAIDETEPEREGVDVEGELSDFMTHQIETASGPGFMAALMKGTEAQAPWEPSVLFPARGDVVTPTARTAIQVSRP